MPLEIVVEYYRTGYGQRFGLIILLVLLHRISELFLVLALFGVKPPSIVLCVLFDRRSTQLFRRLNRLRKERCEFETILLSNLLYRL